MKKDIVIATSNSGKLEEFRKILGDEKYNFLTLKDIGFYDEIIEDGDSFEANAIIKAKAVADFCSKQIQNQTTENKIWSSIPFILADDSGLEVEALGGAPGIYTARFAGVGASDLDNLNKLLNELQGKSNRHAQFVCVLAVSTPSGNIETFRGEVKGLIQAEPRGEQGFGYDPIFAPKREINEQDDYSRTFAEMSHDEKKSDSHRGRAILKLSKANIV